MNIEYIKSIKRERGLTNEMLSKLSGVPIGTLNKILSGNTPDPQFETVKSICNALGISLSDLDGHEGRDVNSKYTSSDPAFSPQFLSNNERRILALFSELNEEGQEKVLSYSDDLVSSGRYIKTHTVGMVE